MAGGGAALLEIEDLVFQQQRNSNDDESNLIACIQAGGCRDQCTEGPNVRVLLCNNGSSGNRSSVDVDFHRVNSPEACRRVVNSLCPRKSTITLSCNVDDGQHYNSQQQQAVETSKQLRPFFLRRRCRCSHTSSSYSRG